MPAGRPPKYETPEELLSLQVCKRGSLIVLSNNEFPGLNHVQLLEKLRDNKGLKYGIKYEIGLN